MKRRFGFAKKRIPVKVDEFTITDSYRMLVQSQSYLGKKGYTILKKCLDPKDEAILKRELMMQPFVCGGPVTVESTPFPVYRENAAKIYIPRFYGIARYGDPHRSEIQEGQDIEVEFTSSGLRDYQTNIVNIYMTHVNALKEANGGEAKGGGGAILEVPCGRGKTVMALNIVTLLKKKTLILVHKEFLMNQWIERAQEFVPKAKIGKIQGPIFDIEGKDIVIGMIQTMYSREFPQDAFDGFGLTIIDEVHRIGSEEFSKTLLKVSTKYMLGISATVERKDRLTKILYMFIGPKIYEEERDTEDPVIVRGIEYITKDEEFNQTECDFRGTPKFSTMISKLCDYGPRKDFIVKIVQDLIQENPDNQIMILAHNRSLLTYLYDSIMHKSIATAGYYLGGMKEHQLKETETKQVVIATYAMAAEALDIKTLSTLVMATPKTDIEQSIGRILRTRHTNPIVVDVIDSHDLFKNQWRTRKTFYRKCNYKILYAPSTKYLGPENTEWKTEYDPKSKSKIPVDKPTLGGCMIHVTEDELNQLPIL